MAKDASEWHWRWRGGSLGTFRRAMSGPVALAQLFGLMPIGAQSQSGADADAVWRRLGTTTSLAAATGTVAIALLGACWFWVDKSFFRATKVLFHASATVACVLMCRVGRSWPRLVRSWTQAELATCHVGYPPHTVRYCHAFFAIYLFIAVVEHSLAVANALARILPTHPWSEVVHQLYARWFPQLVAVLPYSPALALPVFLLNLVATLTFSFLDILITNVAFCLAAMFRQYNVHLLQATSQEPDNSEWAGLRRDYQILRRLAYVVDDHISQLVLLSFTINLYHICLQLYLSLNPATNAASKVYFWLSFGFLLLRTGAVCTSASAVHEQAAGPKPVLFAVPGHLFCQEVERFLFQVCNDPVAISGLKFFYITRMTIVKLIGLVVTYEVVMFQINSIADDETDVRNNGTNTPKANGNNTTAAAFG